MSGTGVDGARGLVPRRVRAVAVRATRLPQLLMVRFGWRSSLMGSGQLWVARSARSDHAQPVTRSRIHGPALVVALLLGAGSLRPGWAAVPEPGAGPVPGVASTAAVDVATLDRGRILRAANDALDLPPITITAFRASLSEGGPNDFYSNGDYWWPDPSKPEGLPYIQRDGESNPNNFTEHRRCVMQLRDAVAALGAAYRLTGEERYAQKAAVLVRVFFVDPKTRMTPRLDYAQAIPGRVSGRGTGIIDTLHLAEVPIALLSLEGSRAFTPELAAGLKRWFGDYVEWMLTSKNGQEEAKAANNHSVAFWLQVAAFSRFTRDEARLAECRARFKEVLVPAQMAVDGSFPAELRRTKPYGYSIFQLDNLAALCQVLSTPEDDLWHFSLPDGRGMSKGMEFLYPCLADKSKWPRKPDIQAWAGWPVRQPCLLFAGLALGEPKYLALWRKLSPDPRDSEVRRNMAITQPLLWLRPNAVLDQSTRSQTSRSSAGLVTESRGSIPDCRNRHAQVGSVSSDQQARNFRRAPFSPLLLFDPSYGSASDTILCLQAARRVGLLPSLRLCGVG